MEGGENVVFVRPILAIEVSMLSKSEGRLSRYQLELTAVAMDVFALRLSWSDPANVRDKLPLPSESIVQLGLKVASMSSCKLTTLVSKPLVGKGYI